MADGFIVRKGGVTSEATAAPTITIVSEDPTGVTFTVTNNDDNTAVIVYEIDTTQDFVELAAAATSSNITVALAVGTYTLTAFATVVGEVASSATASVEIVVPAYELLAEIEVATNTTEVNLTNFTATKDDGLVLVYTMKNDSAGTNRNYFIYVNNDTTQTNYYTQYLNGSGTSLAAARFNGTTLMDTNNTAKGQANIKVSNNDRVVIQNNVMSHGLGSNASGIRNNNWNIVNTTTISTITAVKVVAQISNAIGVGSKFQLYKVTEAA